MDLLINNIENYFRQTFAQDFVLACCSGDVSESCLNSSELNQFINIGKLRQTSWLRGRIALKQLLEKLQEDNDSSKLLFPHRYISLSHSKNVAIAIAFAEKKTHGAGVDIEFIRPVKESALRFYLSENEQNWIRSLSEPKRAEEALLRWSIKEAVFKADLNNRNRTLRMYELRDPSKHFGLASFNSEKEIAYDSLVMTSYLGNFCLAVAKYL